MIQKKGSTQPDPLPRSRTYLTDRFFAWFGLCQLVGMFSILFPPLLLFYLGSFLALLLMTFTDYFRWIPFSSFSASVRIPRHPEVGQEVSVDLEIENRHPKALSIARLFLTLPTFQVLRFEENGLPIRWSLKEDRYAATLTVKAVAQSLGYEALRWVMLQAYSPLGLWLRSFPVATPKAEFRVIPTRRKVSEQSFHERIAGQRILYQGNRQMLKGQAAEQFHSIREYQYPDSIRHIDARKSAKFGQLMTRTYDSFFQHHLVLVLDTGRSMCGRLGPSQKKDYYLAACLALAENALMSRDKVSFFAFSQKVHFFIRNTRRLESFHPVFAGHPSLKAREEESNFDLIHPTLNSLTGQRSIVILFADISRPSVQAELFKAIQPLLGKHLIVVVSLMDEAYDLSERILTLDEAHFDLKTYNQLLYTYWLNESERVFQRRLASRGGGVVVVPEMEWLSVVERLYGLLRVSMRI
jgi:uncharacterized protein (DUF58 family)